MIILGLYLLRVKNENSIPKIPSTFCFLGAEKYSGEGAKWRLGEGSRETRGPPDTVINLLFFWRPLPTTSTCQCGNWETRVGGQRGTRGVDYHVSF